MELLHKGLRKNLGNGKEIKMFKDPRLPLLSTFKVVSSNAGMDEMKVSEFLTPSLQWDVRIFSAHLLQDDVDFIKNFPIRNFVPDIWFGIMVVLESIL